MRVAWPRVRTRWCWRVLGRVGVVRGTRRREHQPADRSLRCGHWRHSRVGGAQSAGGGCRKRWGLRACLDHPSCGDSTGPRPHDGHRWGDQPRGGSVGAAFTGGGSGYFAGGHGASLEVSEFGNGDLASREHYSGGGGGGSGFLAAGVDQIEVRDNVGDGFARITYTVPEPDVVDTVEPQLTLGAAAVRAGGSVTLRGSGLDPEREYPVILNSDPVLLGTVTTDEEGAFDASLTIPASVPAGEHVITVGDASIPITVLAAEGTVDAPPTRLIADEGQGGLELAATGADPAAASILGLVAAALLAAGAAAVRASRQPQRVRRRQPERQPVPARRAATPAQ